MGADPALGAVQPRMRVFAGPLGSDRKVACVPFDALRTAALHPATLPALGQQCMTRPCPCIRC